MNFFSITEMIEHVLSLAYIWAICLIGSYSIIRWGFDETISFHKALRWVSGVIGTLVVLVGILYLLPLSWRIFIKDLFIPRLLCASALHLFLLSLDRFIRHRKGTQGMKPTRLVVAIFLVYLFSMTGVLLITYGGLSEFLCTISLLTSSYLVSGALLATLFLEIYGGRCKNHKNHEFEEKQLSSSNTFEVNSSNDFFSRF